MKINNIELTDNSILYTNNIWKWIVQLRTKKNTKVITPMTKISELLSITSSSTFFSFIKEQYSEEKDHIFNEQSIAQWTSIINKLFETKIMEYEMDLLKSFKLLFKITDEYVTETFIQKYILFLSKHTIKHINIVIVGFETEKYLLTENYSLLNIFFLTRDFKKVTNWKNIECLVFLDIDDGFQIINKDKLLNWLELKTRTVLSIKDINDFFENKQTMNTYLIDRAISNI